MMMCRKLSRLGFAGLIAALAGFFLGVDRASAQTCMQNVWAAHGNSQNLTCTANDVTLSSVDNICVVVSPPGGPGDENGDGCKDANTCVGGQNFTFSADYHMPLTAQARYDLGLYIATDGGGADGAITGLCANNVLTASNSPTFDQKDPSPPDLCGDIDSNPNPQVFRQTITTMCNASGGQAVTLPYCTSWRQPGSNEVCDSTTFATAATWDSFPGSPSKCNCGTVTIDVFSETASISVTKTASPTTVSEIGGSVQFTVGVTNNAEVSDVTLDSLEDLIPSPSGTNIVYGDLLNPSGPYITATTCDDDLPIVIAAGQTFTCTFDVTLGPGDTGDSVTDTVEACGTDDFGHSNLCASDPATVTYTDNKVDPDLDKTASLNAVQVDVNFAVVVTNNSTVDTLTVNTLTDDKFGDITTAHAAGGGFGQVVSTTCATGGTIPPNDGAGPNVNLYSCSFVGRILSTGLHTDKVNGTATDDDAFTYPGACVNSSCLEDTADVNISVTFP